METSALGSFLGMMMLTRTFGLLASLGTMIAALAIATSVPAAALSETDMYGKWCGDSNNPHLTNQTFTRDTMTITFRSDGDRQVTYQVRGFEVSAGIITVRWINAQKDNVYTVYGEFSPDGGQMVQQSSSVGPRYIFRRC